MSSSFEIDYDKLHQLEKAFIRYELAKHFVNPKETLEGTTLRIKNNEGYKQGVFDKYHAGILSGPPYTKTIMEAFPGANLTDYHQKSVLEDVINSGNEELLEIGLAGLYNDEGDAEAFRTLVGVIGGRFDVLGFLFFLKDCNKYLPSRSPMTG